jgi:hypothetical protein
MRDKDFNLLQEAYQTVLETDLNTLGMGQATADDYADRANPHSPTDTLVPQQPTPQQGETNEHKAHVAMQLAVSQLEKKQPVGEETLKLIALDQESAEKYGLYLIQHGLPIPQIIKAASPQYSKSLEDYANSNNKN